METNEFEIVTPIESGIDFITSDKVAEDDVLLLWDVDAQQWKNFTIGSLQTRGFNQAQYLSHHLLFDKTSDISKATGELSYNGIDNINVIYYEPNQSVNMNDDVTFSSVTVDEGIFADYDLLLESQTISLRADNIRFLNKDGTKAAIDLDVKGDVYGNAASADKVNHNFSVLTTDTYTSATLGTIEFNGISDVKYWIYKPDQDINTTANVKFKSVTAPIFNGDLNGNATSADKVNRDITIKTVNELEIPTVVSFDGSATKSIQIYMPNQEVNTTSTVQFNVLNINKLNAGPSVFSGIVEVESPYYIKGNIQGNATSADKVNHKVSQGYTNKISEVTSNVEFDGSSDKTITVYRPNQNVNSTDDVEFNTIKTTKIASPNFEVVSDTGNHLGELIASDGKSILNITEVNANLNGNATSADKVNENITVSTIDSISSDSIDSVTFDGSAEKSITIKQYDNKIDALDKADADNTKAINDEIKRATDVEADLQRQIDNTNETVAGITSFEYSKVDSFENLPETGTKGVIYLVPRNPGKNNDIYTEYIYNAKTSQYESIGVTAAELSEYVLTTTLTAYQETIAKEQEDQTKAIEDEVKTRTDEIAEVKGLITTEAETRDSEYQLLTKAIEDEGKTRKNEDEILAKAIEDEAKLRKDNDDSLQSKIDDEAKDRSDGDTALQTAIDDLTFIQSAELTTGKGKDVLTLTDRAEKATTIDIPHILQPGTNVSIEDDVISVSDTTYGQGDNIRIDENNLIHGDYKVATAESDGLMSKEDKQNFDTITNGFYEYSLVQDKVDGHIISLVGERAGSSKTAGSFTIPDNDHKYTLSIDEVTRQLTITGKLSEDDESPLVSTVTLPDDDTRYILKIYDHEFYMFTHKQFAEFEKLGTVDQEIYIKEHSADNTLLHVTLPDNDHEYKAGKGISIDKETGVISSLGDNTSFIQVSSLPTENVNYEAIYLLEQYTVEDNPSIDTYKMYIPKKKNDTDTDWIEVGKSVELATATEEDIDKIIALETSIELIHPNDLEHATEPDIDELFKLGE